MHEIIKKTQMIWGSILTACCVLFSFLLMEPEDITASELDNAYLFYEKYGSEMLFQMGQSMEGEIYYATKAKRANTGIQYTTLGWKVTIYDNRGAEMDVLYYQLGGNNMLCIDIQNISGYEYCLYKVTLKNLKERMNDDANRVLGYADARIIFDACTTTKIDGKVQGAMTDEGPSEGLVFETYEGIANAESWSEITKETLKSYYNKEVKGLFYNVELSAGEGIVFVDGAGRYCFGAEVKIQAKVEEGYHFTKWVGKEEVFEEYHSFMMGAEDVSLTALGEMNQYNIVFDSNGGTGKIPTLCVLYSQQMSMPSSDIFLEGYSLCGWSVQRNAVTPDYIFDNPVSVSELAEKMKLSNVNNGTIILYAVWDQAPIISGNDIYVSLRDAQEGKITEKWLANYVKASDFEDGQILYGDNFKNEFGIMDYMSTDFTEFKKDGAVTETFYAIDSAGNETKKRITIHIVDTAIYDAKIFLGIPRFISAKYYRDATGRFIDEDFGGLKEKSLWRKNASYTQVLDTLFGY